MSKKTKQHHNRNDLTGEYYAGDAGQLTYALIFIITWLADSFLIEYSTFLNQYIPVFIRIPLGVFILLISGLLARNGLKIIFGEKRDKPCVVRKGVFNIVRHPVYLSEILLYLGLLVINISIIAAIIWTLGIGFLHYISRYEESLLIQRFGEEYKQYKKEVPMWIPRFRKK